MQPWMNAQQSAQQAGAAARDAHLSAMRQASEAAQRAGQHAAEQARIGHQPGMRTHHHQPRSRGGFLSAIVKFVLFLVWLAVLAAILPVALELLRNR